jgi:hypothetical protein
LKLCSRHLLDNFIPLVAAGDYFYCAKKPKLATKHHRYSFTISPHEATHISRL